jgi:hypothetical protein
MGQLWVMLVLPAADVGVSGAPVERRMLVHNGLQDDDEAVWVPDQQLEPLGATVEGDGSSSVRHDSGVLAYLGRPLANFHGDIRRISCLRYWRIPGRYSNASILYILIFTTI